MSSLAAAGPRLRRIRRSVRRVVLARRRPLAALCAAAAVVTGVHAVAAPPPASVPVTTAAHDLPAGTVLDDADLAVTEFDPGTVPDGIAAEPAGHTLAAPLRAGEPVTDVRLVGESLADAHPGLTTLPVRLPDAGLADLLSPGDRIDLIATDPQAGSTQLVATDVLVLATPSVADQPPAAGSTGGAPVLLGVPPGSATAVADAGVRWFLSWSFTH